MPKNKPNILLITLASVFFVFILFVLYQLTNRSNSSLPIACPADAKLCPDGSAVGRTGSKCEFQPCIQDSPTSIPTSNPTSNWKTYANSKFSFSFNYPSNYSFTENLSNNYVSIISPIDMTNRKGYELQNGELKVEFWISPNTDNKSLNSYFDDQVRQTNLDPVGIGAKVLSTKDLTIAGIPAKSLTWQGVGTGTNYYLIFKNIIFTVNQYPAITSRQSDFDKILASIKFTP